MKRSLLVLTLATAAALLTGCNDAEDDRGNPTPSGISPHYVNLPDGRAVLCVYEGQYQAGGPSCDWSNAK